VSTSEGKLGDAAITNERGKEDVLINEGDEGWISLSKWKEMAGRLLQGYLHLIR